MFLNFTKVILSVYSLTIIVKDKIYSRYLLQMKFQLSTFQFRSEMVLNYKIKPKFSCCVVNIDFKVKIFNSVELF